MQISQDIQNLYRRLIAIERIAHADTEDTEKVTVDDVIGKLAFFYEKLRTTIDFKEEHLLRRFAIERDIKRRIVLENLKPKIALSLVEDLIRSGYLQNNTVITVTVSKIASIINKYAYLIEIVQHELKDDPYKRRILNWIASVIACEIDLTIVPEDRVDALIETLYSIVKDRINIRGSALSRREKNIQLYITIHQELVPSDGAIISFHLLNLYFPDWERADKHLVEFVANKISSIYHGIHTHLNNPIQTTLAKSLKKQVVAFKVLKDLAYVHHTDLINLFSNPHFFEEEARKVISKVYNATHRKIRRSSIRAILYIFITKIALALIVEYPFELYIMGKIQYSNFVLNVCFPPVLMFFVTLTARTPGTANTKMIIDELLHIVYGEPEQEILCVIKARRFQRPIYFALTYFFYILLYGFIFGMIIYVLSILKFNILSGSIFIFFLTAVCFFGTRIRYMASEYLVQKKREGLSAIVILFFTLPIIRAGHWLSYHLRRINLFTFIFDFIIEAPFKLLIELIESWFIFLREKKEETYKNT